MRTFVAGVKPQGTIDTMKERAFIIFGLRDRRANFLSAWRGREFGLLSFGRGRTGWWASGVDCKL